MTKSFYQSGILCFSLLICLFTGSKNLTAQFEPGHYYSEASQKLNYDSMIRSRLSKPLSSSYFVITYPVAGAVTTFGPQFAKASAEIQKANRPKSDIVLVFSNDDGIPETQFNYFMENILHVNLDSVHVIIDDALYIQLRGPGLLLRTLYFHHGKLFSTTTNKVQNLQTNKLPNERFDVKEQKPLALDDSIHSLIRSSDYIYAYNDSTLLIQGSLNDAIYSLNLKNGSVQRIFSLLDFYTPEEIFCQHFSDSDSSLCSHAKNYASYLASRNRRTLMIEKINYQDGIISGFFVVEVMTPNQKAFTYINDVNQKIHVEVGAPDLSAFQGFFTYSIENKAIQIFPVKQGSVKGKEVIISYNSNFVWLDSNTLLTDIAFEKPKSGNPILCNLSRVNNSFEIGKLLEPKTIMETEKKAIFNSLSSFYFQINNSWHFAKDVSPLIYQINEAKPVGEWYGDGSAPYRTEAYKEFAEDPTEEKINFQIHALNSCLNEAYILSYFRYKNSNIFELKDEKFKTIDQIDARHIQGFDRYYSGEFHGNFNLLITDTKIYFLFLEVGKLYLAQYDVVLK